MASIPSIPGLKSIQSVSQLVMVQPQVNVGYQPQPQVFNGIVGQQQPKLLFHYEGENVSEIESDITDHFIEDNTTIQDQIALHPVVITVQGFIGELQDFVPEENLGSTIAGYAQIAAQKLTSISAYTPGLSTTALRAYDAAFQAYQTAALAIKAGASAISSINNLLGGDDARVTTKQQQYYQQFFAYWNSRTLFTVQTPWAVFSNMAILSLKATQSADNDDITEFSVTFKQLRFASLEVTNVNYDQFGRTALQGQSVTNNGNVSLSPSPTSATSMITGLQRQSVPTTQVV